MVGFADSGVADLVGNAERGNGFSGQSGGDGYRDNVILR